MAQLGQPLEAATGSTSPSPELFTIREAKFRDLPAMSKIFQQAFWDEDAVGRFMHPKRQEFPEDVLRYWKRRMRRSLVEWNHSLIVAVDSSTGELLGVADWSREGPGAKHIKAKGWKWILRPILERSVKLINDASERLHPNRAVSDPSHSTAFVRAMPIFAHCFNPPRDDRWDLSVLGVDPAHQGKGVGRKLVAWGIDRSIQENVAASVVSAGGKDKFYERCGFHTIAGNVTEGEGNPLAGIRGGSIIFRDKKRSVEAQSPV